MHISQLLNLTPHPISIILRASGDVITLQPEPTSARITSHYTLQPDLHLDEGPNWTHHIPIARMDLGSLTGIQYDEKGAIKPCIVSLVVLQHMQEVWASFRRSPFWDPTSPVPLVFAPDTGPSAMRDDHGLVTAVTRLLCI